MSYFAAYLLASSLSLGPPVAIQNGSGWLIYTQNEPTVISSYLYNRTHVEPIGGILNLESASVQKFSNCHVEYRKNRVWKVVNGVSYMWELQIVHSHAIDKHFPLSGRIRVNGENVCLAGEVVKPQSNLKWDHAAEQGYEILWPDIQLMLNYDEDVPHGSYSFSSGDLDVPSGHKVKIAFDYIYSYDSISRERFTIYADCRKDFDIYFSKQIYEQTLKITKEWRHFEYVFRMPENANEFNFRFTSLHPATRHTTYIRNFTYKDLDQNDKP